MIRLSRPLLGWSLPTLLLAVWSVATGSAQAQTLLGLASSTGNASTQTAAYGITPSAGTQQFLLTTINPAGSLPADGSLGTTPATTRPSTSAAIETA